MEWLLIKWTERLTIFIPGFYIDGVLLSEEGSNCKSKGSLDTNTFRTFFSDDQVVKKLAIQNITI